MHKQNHDMHDDTAEFAASRFGQWPGEACTEKGFENEQGCGERGTGPTPSAYLFALIVIVCLLCVAGFSVIARVLS